MIRSRDEEGYAYVMLLAAVAVMAVLAGTAALLVSYQVRSGKELELLFRGKAYERAIRDYYFSAPSGTLPTYPGNLEDLLSDPRYLNRRHLRALYSDPMGKGWSIVRTVGGGIAGVASQSMEKPLKQGGFPSEFSTFEGAAHYADWIFLFQPGVNHGGNP